jgi:hypothetical protein
MVGLLVAQGLYYAAHHLATAYLLFHADSATEWSFWGGFDGLAVQQSIHTASLLVGGVIAGAGQRHGLAIGAGVGLLNALLSLGLKFKSREATDELIVFGQPVLHAFVGAVGGVIGSRIWQPAPELPLLTADGWLGREALTTILPDRPVAVGVDPIPWGRILIGIALAVGGTLWAQMIRDFVVVASGGSGHEMRQSQFITWEICVVAQVIGGSIAGANTRGGALFGFWVGLSSAGLLTIALSASDIRSQAHEVPAGLLGLAVPEGTPAALLIQAVQALLLGVVGGWLGGLILPATKQKRRLGAGAR